MERTYLIQRLNTPFETPRSASPFSFGGGLKNGGLTDEAHAVLRTCFEFDYMGAAEFEYGAVPQAFRKMAEMAEANELTTGFIEIDLSEIEQDWREESPKGHGVGVVYVIGSISQMVEIESRVYNLARERYNRDLKEMTRLADALVPTPTSIKYNRTAGWLELNNGFMFFTDETMFTNVATLFGLIESGPTPTDTNEVA